VYIEELAYALGRATGRTVAWAPFDATAPLTPFERKYRDSGQPLYRLAIDFDQADTPCLTTPSGAL
jgi:tRNA (guanine-N7-)-methyltransferase